MLPLKPNCLGEVTVGNTKIIESNQFPRTAHLDGATYFFGKALRLFIQDPSEDLRHNISEISESNLALMVAVIGFYWLIQIKKTS